MTAVVGAQHIDQDDASSIHGCPDKVARWFEAPPLDRAAVQHFCF